MRIPKPLVAVLVACAFVGLSYGLTWALISRKNSVNSDAAMQYVIGKVGKLVVLPNGEPSVFTVDDPEQLVKEQAFFQGVEKGDSLLVYSDAARAILYSARRNRILNMGPITFSDQGLQTQ